MGRNASVRGIDKIRIGNSGRADVRATQENDEKACEWLHLV